MVEIYTIKGRRKKAATVWQPLTPQELLKIMNTEKSKQD